MKNLENIIFDVSINPVSNIQFEVIKLFNKIKTSSYKANPLTSDEIILHFSSCIQLFNENKISSDDLINSVKTLLGKSHSELYYEFLQLFQKISFETNNYEDKSKILKSFLKNSIKYKVRKDIEFGNLSDCGTSYRLLPTDYKHSLCSGRLKNNICNEVLNNNYICFPSMTSEVTSSITSKKNFHEEQLHRLEDERYEVDMHLEINKYAMKYLSKMQKTLESMNKEEKSKFVLDDFLGSSSAILMRKAIYRIYGDASDNMIEGLKARPKMAIPLVLSRMQEKAKDWSHFHTKFKMAWQERANKLYMPSLDYQGDLSKKDAIYLKRSTFVSQLFSLSKTYIPSNFYLFKKDFISVLINTKNDHVYDPLIHTQVLHRAIYGNINELSNNAGVEMGPHVTLMLPADSELFVDSHDIYLKDIIDDSNSLIINQINLQSNISKEDKQSLIDFIYNIIGYFFGCSDAKIPNEIIGSSREQKQRSSELYTASSIDRRFKYRKLQNNDLEEETLEKKIKVSLSTSQKESTNNDSEVSSRHLQYKFLFGNSYIYMFIRLYHIIIDRLTVLKIYGSKTSNDDIDIGAEKDNIKTEENEKYFKVLHMLLDATETSFESIANNESKIRMLFTTKAFLWFTIPRIVQQIVKTSQQIICIGLESSKDLLDSFCSYSSMTPCGTGGNLMNRLLYLKKEKKYATEVLNFCLTQNLTCFLMIYLRQEGRLLIQILDTDDSHIFNDIHSDSDILMNNFNKNTIYTDDASFNQPNKIYEKFIYSTKLLSSNNYPLFLMRNMKTCIKKVTERILRYRKNHSFKMTQPLNEEISYINLKNECLNNDITISDDLFLNTMRSSFQEMYRSVFIGNGDIYNCLFEKENDKYSKNGYLFKRFIFRETKTICRKKLKEVVSMLNDIRTK